MDDTLCSSSYYKSESENSNYGALFPPKKQSLSSPQISEGGLLGGQILEKSTFNCLRSSVVIQSEYELNFISKVDNNIRKSYMSKLIYNNIWVKNQAKTHNTIVIFDWDDTLLCTSYLSPNGVFIDNEDNNEYITPKTREKIKELDNSVYEVLLKAIKFGETYIVTNSEPGWVQYSSHKFYPKTHALLESIKIISARGEYEKKYPGDNKKWKIQTFLDLIKTVDTNLITNILCLGDSYIELEAGHVLASQFPQAFIKTVKFKEAPKPNELNKQLQTVRDQFDKIYNSARNLTIRVERKRK